jgi:hypothetical protein
MHVIDVVCLTRDVSQSHSAKFLRRPGDGRAIGKVEARRRAGRSTETDKGRAKSNDEDKSNAHGNQPQSNRTIVY